MSEETELFVESCRNIFGNNLIAVLYLGSKAREDATVFSDVDYAVIINTMDDDQFFSLKDRISESPGNIDCPVICLDELIGNHDEVAIGQNSCYYWHFTLRNARCLCGNNPFTDWPEPDIKKLKLSVFDKINQYVYWARGLVLASKQGFSIANNHKLNIRIIKVLRDFMFICDDLADWELLNRQVIELFISKHASIIDDNEIAVIGDLAIPEVGNDNAANLSLSYLRLRLSILNKLHKKAVEIVNAG